jgi:hypothetical protein
MAAGAGRARFSWNREETGCRESSPGSAWINKYSPSGLTIDHSLFAVGMLQAMVSLSALRRATER